MTIIQLVIITVMIIVVIIVMIIQLGLAAELITVFGCHGDHCSLWQPSYIVL